MVGVFWHSPSYSARAQLLFPDPESETAGHGIQRGIHELCADGMDLLGNRRAVIRHSQCIYEHLQSYFARGGAVAVGSNPV